MFNNKHKNGKHQVNRSMRPISFPNEKLPRIVDLRQWMPPIDQQYEMNTW